MRKDIDLLPWILGALTMAIVAVAIAVGTTHGPAPTVSQMPNQTAAPPLPVAVTIEAPPPAPSLEPASPPAQVQPVAAPPVQSAGQIWECTTNAQRTFSSKPCGDKSTLREVGPINIMNPTPILQPSRTYQPDANYAPDYFYPDTQQTADNSYSAVIGIPYAVRMRPERTHRPYVHDHAVASRRN